MSTATCRSCGAEIIWARTVNGKLMPVDAAPTVGATVLLVADPDPREPPQAVVVKKGTFMAGAHTSHFTRCPHAKAHRKGK